MLRFGVKSTYRQLVQKAGAGGVPTSAEGLPPVIAHGPRFFARWTSANLDGIPLVTRLPTSWKNSSCTLNNVLFSRYHSSFRSKDLQCQDLAPKSGPFHGPFAPSRAGVTRQAAGRDPAGGRWYCTAQTAVKQLEPTVDPAESTTRVAAASVVDPWVLRRKVVTTSIDRWEEKPQGLSFDVHYIDTGADWSYSRRKTTPTVFGIPGQPGDHNDLLPILKPFHEDGHRVVIVNMPAYENAPGITPNDNECFLHSTMELAEFILHFIGALGLTRLDLVVTHSAGSFPLLVLSPASDIIKSTLIVCSPSGHVPSRINRPLWFIKGIVALWERSLGRTMLKAVLPTINRMTSWLNNDDPRLLMNTARFGAYMNFDLMRSVAMEIQMKRLPMVFLASNNDKLVELELSKEWAEMLGIEGNGYDVYDEQYNLVKEAEVPGEKYIKGVILAKGGHYPQRREVSLPVLIKEAKALLGHVLQNEKNTD